MRDLSFRLLYGLTRALRPSGKRRLQPLRAGTTVLYTQFEKPLGCCVHGTPLVEALHGIAPGVRLIVATRGMGAETLRHHPLVSDLIEVELDPAGSFRAAWRTAAAVRARLHARAIRPDVVVQDASSRRRSAGFLAALLRVAPTVGFGDAAGLYDVHLPYDPARSLIANTLRVAGVLGGGAEHREPAVYFSSAAAERAESLLSELPPEHRGRIGYVLQGSGGQRTGWHDERFAAVIMALEREGYGSVFLGTEADHGGIDRVRSRAESAGVSFAGRTTVAEAAAVLCQCDLLITLDTGTMHLGRAVGVPMVVLGPSWQPPVEWLPLGLERVQILRGADRDGVPADYRLDEIEAAQVLAAAGNLLTRYPPNAEARQTRTRARLSNVRSG